MTAPVITWRPRWNGGPANGAWLGEVFIGHVVTGEGEAGWTCYLETLGDYAVIRHRARDEATAKAALEAAVSEWCRRAGVAG